MAEVELAVNTSVSQSEQEKRAISESDISIQQSQRIAGAAHNESQMTEESSAPSSAQDGNVRQQACIIGVTVEDALRHTGGFGRFQLKAAVMFQGVCSMFSATLYYMTFFELQPSYLCQANGQESEWNVCKREDFCENLGGDANIEYKIDKENPIFLKNWV